MATGQDVGVDIEDDRPFKPMLMLAENVRCRDSAGLAALSATQRAQQLRARVVLHDYVVEILDAAEAAGQSWLTDSTISSWVGLRDLTALLVQDTQTPASEGRPAGGTQTVTADVLAAAWELVRLLDGERYGISPQEAGARMLELREHTGLPELFRGHLMLIGVLTQLLLGRPGADIGDGGIPAPPEEYGTDADPFKNLLPAALIGLRRAFPDLDPAALPLLADALTAALLRQDVLAWGEQHAPAPSRDERLGAAYLVWSLATIYADATDTPGALHTLITDMLTDRSPQP